MQPLTGLDLPHLVTEIPGPQSRQHVDVLARHECPAITSRRARRASALGVADDDPFIWKEALGANVRDVDGNTFVDLTAGFAVALLGHRHPAVVSAIAAQSHTLLHAMGDAWPDAARIRLLAALAKLAPEGLDAAILGLSGSDAIDAAIKTAALATSRPGILAFEGGYHGLALGPLALQGYKPAFTEPFREITHPHVTHLPFGCDAAALDAVLGSGHIGLVMVEPVQGRGGMRVPPNGWLTMLADRTRAHGALLAFDEIQSGLGRTGTMWACDHESVVPDLLCTGKALGGGLPLSACLGTAAAMNAWGASQGEALHTQTFLGHPLGCAAALAVLDALQHDAIAERCAALGQQIRSAFEARGFEVRGRGLMIGVVMSNAFLVCRALQARGYIALPAGMHTEVLALTPSAHLSPSQLSAFMLAFDEAYAQVHTC